MRGVILLCLQEMVESRYGKNHWHEILEKSGSGSSSMVLSVQTIPDEQFERLRRAALQVLDVNAPELGNLFGEYWIRVYAQKYYKTYFLKNQNARELLMDMDRVHLEMTRMAQGAAPPRFRYEWTDAKTLVIHYQSRRNLMDFLAGLIRGVAGYYHEDIDIRVISPSEVRLQF